MLFLISVVLFNISIQAQTGTETWAPTEENAPQRAGHSMVQLSDGRVMMFGGEDENADLFNDLHVFQDNEWNEVVINGSVPPERKDHAAWLETDDKMYVFGGLGENHQLMNDLWSYDPAANAWTEEVVTGQLPLPRWHASVINTPESETIILGGQIGDAHFLNDVWSFSSGTNSFKYLRKINEIGFTQLPNNCPHEVWGQGLFFHNGHIFIPEIFLGGTSMFKLNTSTRGWITTAASGDTPVFSPLAATVELANGILKIGGWGYFTNALYKTEGFEASKETWFFDYDTETWSQKADLPLGLFSATAYFDSVNQRVKVYGGMKADSTLNDLVYVFNVNPTGINENDEIPTRFSLEQNYPNPFNPSTTINYYLANAGEIILTVYDLLGREVEVIDKGFRQSGKHEVFYNAEKLDSGVYFYCLRTKENRAVRKFILLK